MSKTSIKNFGKSLKKGVEGANNATKAAAKGDWKGVEKGAREHWEGVDETIRQGSQVMVGGLLDNSKITKDMFNKKKDGVDAAIAAGEVGMGQGLADYQNAIRDYINNGNREYVNAGDLGASSMGSIKIDPRYADHEQAALADLEQISRDGFSARDMADLARSDGRVNRQAAGRQGAIQQSMAARGMAGSGMELIAQQQAAQDATEQQALASLEKNAQAQEGRRSAISQRGQLSGQLSARDFQQQAQQAQAQDQIARFNQANRQQIANANTAGYNQHQGTVLNARQAGAQMGYNAGSEAANRAGAAAQAKKNSQAGMLGTVGTVAGGIVGGVYGGPVGAGAGATAGGAAGQGLGNYVYAAHGAVIKGPEMVPGDDPANDIVPAMVSPGEAVVSKSDLDLFSSIQDPTVQSYLRDKYAKNDPEKARSAENFTGFASVAAQAGDRLANANKPQMVYHNRMQELGSAPRIDQGPDQHNDMSGYLAHAVKNTANIENNRDEVVKAAFEQRKAELQAKVEADKAAKDAARLQQDFDLRSAGQSETARHNKATEQALKANRDAAQAKASAAPASAKQTPAQAKQVAKSDEVNYRVKSINSALDRLEKNVSDNGTFEAFGTSSANMESDIYNVALDYAKLVDPESVAREGEVAAAKKYMLPIQGMFTRNSTAKALIDDMRAKVKQRATDIAPASQAQPSAPTSASKDYDSMSDEELEALLKGQ